MSPDSGCAAHGRHTDMRLSAYAYGKHSIKTAELLERIAAALENGSAPAETSSADGAEEPGREHDAE